MYGLTEFNIFHEKKGWVIKLVTGKNGTVVMTGTKYYANRDTAYAAAERLWGKLREEAAINKLPVRFAHLK